jgi:hypothetical protein
MRVDRRPHVRDLTLARDTIWSAGVEIGRSRAKSERLSKYKNLKFVLDPSWPKPFPAWWLNQSGGTEC